MWKWIVSCLLLAACSGGVSVPKGVLPPDRMQEVLHDMIKADEMVDFLRLTDSAYHRFERRTALYDTVFGLHGVTKETVQNSLRFYQGRPDLLRDMMNELHAKITDTTGETKPKPEVVN